MRSWRGRRRKRLERAEAEADALILDLGATAYSQARRREHEASSDAMAREWNQVALAVARKTGQTLGLNASTRVATDAKPVAQFRIQFFGVPTDRANHLGGSRPAGFGRVHSDKPSGSRCVASSRDWILPDRSRRPRSLRTAEGRSLVGVMHDARSSLRGHQRRASALRRCSPSCSTIVGPASRNIRGGRVAPIFPITSTLPMKSSAQAAPQVESPAPTERSRPKPRTEASLIAR
jgi:hypothetical protein